mmetsp:Transcript_52003/g.156069  ORF Transcript_52003/g.156069 Transcript_52003/m.156069 type:complete len:206 (-) Transcript_52003:1440-2057(-)
MQTPFFRASLRQRTKQRVHLYLLTTPDPQVMGAKPEGVGKSSSGSPNSSPTSLSEPSFSNLSRLDPPPLPPPHNEQHHQKQQQHCCLQKHMPSSSSSTSSPSPSALTPPVSGTATYAKHRLRKEHEKYSPKGAAGLTASWRDRNVYEKSTAEAWVNTVMDPSARPRMLAGNTSDVMSHVRGPYDSAYPATTPVHPTSASPCWVVE